LHLNFRHLSMKKSTSKKWLTKSSTICRPFFRALVFSSGQLHAPAQEQPRKSMGPTLWCTNITTIIVSVNKQNRGAQTCKRDRSAVLFVGVYCLSVSGCLCLQLLYNIS
jgi:hypothetical protein